jgi:DNA-binding NtrC family response regulator
VKAFTSGVETTILPTHMPAARATEPITVSDEDARRAGRGSSQPTLIVLGSASEGGGLANDPRVVTFDHSVEIGRRPQGHMGIATCCLSGARVSGRHARVTKTRPGVFEVVDLGSRNGTLVEGHPIAGPTRIGDGSLLYVGGYALVLRVLSADVLDAIEEERNQPFGPVATAASQMALSVRRLRRLARAQDEILLSGETGVGKEVYARAVHRASGRQGRFVALNCAALPTDLVESELYGFVRGAHSQASTNKPGLIEQAEGGTLFLDEIGDMPGPAQAKLLRFLQEREYVPLGGREVRRIDTRVIGATSNLGTAAGAMHGLRRDLAARFGAEPVILPPLRDRREDVGALAAHFLGRRRTLGVSTFLALCLHDWPLNVRELEKAMSEAILYSEGHQEIQLEHLPRSVSERLSPTATSPAPRRRSPRPSPTREELEALLVRHDGNVAEVARELDRQWAVVWRWIVKAGLDVDKLRK